MMKTLMSSLTVVAALTLSGAAFAQPMNTIGGKDIAADQMDEVQAACDKLAAGTSTPMAGGTSNDTTNTAGQSESESTDEWDVTAEQCVEAGFTAAAAN